MGKTNQTNLAYKLLVIYIFTHYIIQIFIQYLYADELSVKYNGWDYSPFYAIYTIIFFFIVYYFVDRSLPVWRLKTVYKFWFLNILKWLFLIVFALLAINFSLNYGIDFRHTNRLGDTGFLVQILFFLRSIALYVLFIYFCYFLRGYDFKLLDRVYLFLLMFFYALIITSSIQTIVLAIFLPLIFLSNTKLRVLFMGDFISFKRVIIVSILLGIVLVCSVFVGIANKYGVERAIGIFTEADKFNYLIGLVSKRITTSYFSLLIMARDHMFDFTLQFQIYLDHFETFLHRLSIFIPIFDLKLEDVRTLNHENFLLLFQNNTKAITGASPGLLASIFYIPIFPFNFILMSIYLVVVFRVLDIYIGFKKINILSVLVVFYLTYNFFGGPHDLMKIIDPRFLYFVLFITGVFFIKKSNDNNQILEKGKDVI